jgi:hypothetical protein
MVVVLFEKANGMDLRKVMLFSFATFSGFTTVLQVAVFGRNSCTCLGDN